MDKKGVLILASVALVSFGGSLAMSVLFGTSSPVAQQVGDVTAGTPQTEESPLLSLATPTRTVDTSPKAKQLDTMIKELRLKTDEYRQLTKRLEEREKRVQMAEALLEKQAKELEGLRMQLVGPLTRLQETLASIKSTRVDITKQEIANLRHMATMYDKMDPAKASEIFTGYCANDKIDFAAKLMKYMQQKKAAKVLEAIVDIDSVTAQKLSERMKMLNVEG